MEHGVSAKQGRSGNYHYNSQHSFGSEAKISIMPEAKTEKRTHPQILIIKLDK